MSNEPNRAYCVRHWLTHNQTPERVLERFKELENSDLVRAGVAQIEGPGKNGRYHLQGYVQLTKPARKTQVIPLLWKSTEWIGARGTGDHNVVYCSKIDVEGKDNRAEGTEPVTFGKIDGNQGRRTDLENIKEMMDAGASMREVAGAHFGDFIRYHRGLYEYRKISRNVNRGKPEVEMIWGPSGTGKSLYARTLYPADADTYWLAKPNTNDKNARLWWDGYDGQGTVVIDEFYGWMPYDFFLRLIDYGPLQVQTKGGVVDMVATKFIFTSNLPPEEWYNLSTKPDNGYPFVRRIMDFCPKGIQETNPEFLQEVLDIIEIQSDEEGDETGALSGPC